MSSSNAWIPVATSRSLDPGKVMPVVVDDVRIALWRSVSGTISGWIDRCPHRGMRLSLGAVAGETLICPYHGWTFATDGQCATMPAHPGTTPARTARARTLPTREEGGFVWMRLSQQAGVDDDHAPTPEVVGDPIRTMYLDGTPEAVLGALLINPLVGLPSPPWSDWLWTGQDDVLQVSAACGPELYTATIVSDTVIECSIAYAADREVRYAYRLHLVSPGVVAVHLLATQTPDVDGREVLLQAFAATRRWMELNRHDALWREASRRVRLQPTPSQAQQA